MKKCPRCNEIKEDALFLFIDDKPSGRCKPCRTLTNAENREYRSERYKANREVLLAKMKVYHEENKEAKAEYKRKYYAENKEKINQKGRDRQKNLSKEQRREISARRYGKDYDWWITTFNSQGNKCAICGSPTSQSKLDFSVDHCHVEGRVRGILCTICNTGLGKFRDSIANLQSAIDYLIKHSTPQDSPRFLS